MGFEGMGPLYGFGRGFPCGSAEFRSGKRAGSVPEWEGARKCLKGFGLGMCTGRPWTDLGKVRGGLPKRSYEELAAILLCWLELERSGRFGMRRVLFWGSREQDGKPE